MNAIAALPPSRMSRLGVLNLHYLRGNATFITMTSHSKWRYGTFSSSVFSSSIFYNFIIRFLEHLGCLFLGLKTSSRKNSATHPNQVSVVYSSTHRGVRGFYGLCQDSGELPPYSSSISNCREIF